MAKKKEAAPTPAPARDVDRDNSVWFERHSVRYCFTAETPLSVRAESVDRALFGMFIRAPFPRAGVARWGFLTERNRDEFCKRFKGTKK